MESGAGRKERKKNKENTHTHTLGNLCLGTFREFWGLPERSRTVTLLSLCWIRISLQLSSFNLGSKCFCPPPSLHISPAPHHPAPCCANPGCYSRGWAWLPARPQAWSWHGQGWGNPRGRGPCGCSGSKEGSGADLSRGRFHEARRRQVSGSPGLTVYC